jgi:hypothetical protein
LRHAILQIAVYNGGHDDDVLLACRYMESWLHGTFSHVAAARFFFFLC